MSWHAVSRRDLLTVLDATRFCGDAQDAAGFAERVVAELFRLIACDHAAYNEVFPSAGMSWGKVTPDELLRPEWHEVLGRHGQENPLVSHGMEEPGDVPRSWSETMSASDLHRTNLYNLMYRVLGAEDQLAGIVTAGPEMVAGAVVTRGRQGFSDRDRAVLDMFRFQLAPIRRHLEVVAPLKAAAVGGMALLGVSRSGAVTWAVGDSGLLSEVSFDRSGAPRSSLGVWVRELSGKRTTEVVVSRFVTPHGAITAKYIPGDSEDQVVLVEEPESPAGPIWDVRLLGGFSLTGPLGPVRLQGKTADLVKVLALSGSILVLDEVVERLWSGISPELGRRRLRNLLHRLPHHPGPVVVRRGEALSLAPGVRVDITDFEEAVNRAVGAARRGDAEAAVLGDGALARYRADLLPEDTFQEWATAPREHLRRRRLDLLDTLADSAERAGDLALAASLLADGVRVDPLDEVRQLRLAWLHVRAGRPAAALALMRRAQTSAAQLGVTSLPEWSRLAEAARTT